MADVLFIEYPKCSTCKKAKAWLHAPGGAEPERPRAAARGVA